MRKIDKKFRLIGLKEKSEKETDTTKRGKSAREVAIVGEHRRSQEDQGSQENQPHPRSHGIEEQEGPQDGVREHPEGHGEGSQGPGRGAGGRLCHAGANEQGPGLGHQGPPGKGCGLRPGDHRLGRGRPRRVLRPSATIGQAAGRQVLLHGDARRQHHRHRPGASKERAAQGVAGQSEGADHHAAGGEARDEPGGRNGCRPQPA